MEEPHGPRIVQPLVVVVVALLSLKAPSRTFSAALGTEESAALGAATATLLESARMNASEDIVASPRISICFFCSDDC